jgi:hypothetical protein
VKLDKAENMVELFLKGKEMKIHIMHVLMDIKKDLEQINMDQLKLQKRQQFLIKKSYPMTYLKQEINIKLSK